MCASDKRDRSLVCVVEEPLQVLALEKTGYNGLYHVLHGVISPLHNIGPEELKIRELVQRLHDDEIKEIIIATNPTMEGEATAMYIKKLIGPIGVSLSRIASGLPVGGDLEYADDVTLTKSLEGRKQY